MVRRRRRRRNARTQRPVSVTVHRTGTGRATELTTYTWASAPTAWDDAAAQMAAQVRKAKRKSEKAAKKRAVARKVSRKERHAEKWRAQYRKASTSPFDGLPGLAGRSETTRARQPVMSSSERRQSGVAPRGSPSTLTPELAGRVLELRAEGMSYQRIGGETGHPATTVRYWVVSGRASVVSEAGGQTRKG